MNNVVYLGNKELLKLPKTAFLASSTIPVDMVLKCYDWAVKMRDEGRCAISGFSSRLENCLPLCVFFQKNCQTVTFRDNILKYNLISGDRWGDGWGEKVTVLT